jgi:hypothetical protein
MMLINILKKHNKLIIKKKDILKMIFRNKPQKIRKFQKNKSKIMIIAINQTNNKNNLNQKKKNIIIDKNQMI